MYVCGYVFMMPCMFVNMYACVYVCMKVSPPYNLHCAPIFWDEPPILQHTLRAHLLRLTSHFTALRVHLLRHAPNVLEQLTMSRARNIVKTQWSCCCYCFCCSWCWNLVIERSSNGICQKGARACSSKKRRSSASILQVMVMHPDTQRLVLF